jgi:hypothetical protein
VRQHLDAAGSVFQAFSVMRHVTLTAALEKVAAKRASITSVNGAVYLPLCLYYTRHINGVTERHTSYF